MVGMHGTARVISVSRRPASHRAWWPAGLAVVAAGWGAQQFTPLLLMYQARLHLSATTVQAVFGLYVAGLIPGLLLGGPVSDRFGRRRVMAPVLGLSVVATALLVLGGGSVGPLYAGRLLTGVAGGAAFSAGAAWIKELSALGPSGGAGHAPRRLTVAMSAGFGLGPLVAGVLAQWAPAPAALPYVPHLALAAAALVAVLRAAETRPGDRSPASRGLSGPRGPRLPELRERRFRLVVVPLAPWVFGSASVALAYLPEVVRPRLGGHALVFSAVVILLTAFAGILAQPPARRMDGASVRLLATSLSLVVGGLLVAALAAAVVRPSLVVVAALVLGAGYGCCQVYGLSEVQRMARPEHLAGLTAAYQAVSYIGLALPFPLAAAGRLASPGVLLLVVAGLAALTLAWTAPRARPGTSADRRRAGRRPRG